MRSDLKWVRRGNRLGELCGFYSLCENLRLIAAEIRKIDTVHELHVNPHDVATPNYFKGQSVFEEGKIVDFVGCLAHPSWHSVRFAPDRIDQSVAYYADLMKSTTRHKEDKFWVSELQGGTNIFPRQHISVPILRRYYALALGVARLPARRRRCSGALTRVRTALKAANGVC